jgi:antirestriction protein ArdC
MDSKQAAKSISTAVERLYESLGKGESAQLRDYLAFMGRFHKYSFGNCLLIQSQCPTASHVAGYRRWQELGRHVKKGETSIRILAPMRFKRKPKEGQDESETSYGIRGFRCAAVFDISQTEGESVPEFSRANGDPGEYLDALEQTIRDRDISLEYRPLGQHTLGFSAGGEIVIEETLPPVQRFAVGVHELAHELLHKREDRETLTKQVKETEAESIAYVVCSAVGIDSLNQTADYLTLYRSSADILGESLARIQKTAAEIIAAITESKPALATS